jgi:hypothetical protein
MLIALNAKRMTAANGLGWSGADHCQSARRQQRQNQVTHEVSFGRSRSLIDSSITTQAGCTGSRQLTLLRPIPLRFGQVFESVLASFFADDILDCIVEAFDEIVDPLILSHKIVKRAV